MKTISPSVNFILLQLSGRFETLSCYVHDYWSYFNNCFGKFDCFSPLWLEVMLWRNTCCFVHTSSHIMAKLQSVWPLRSFARLRML